MYKYFEILDTKIIYTLRKYGDWIGRIALFLIFFWFGFLKVIAVSPAGPLVTELLQNTFLSFLEPNSFQAWFGIFEMVIALLVLIPKLERVTFVVMGFHFITTVMPLAILPGTTWAAFLVPTLTGQYIIKNAALLALGLLLMARIKPMAVTHHFLAEEDL
jgi:uncharacterized membrane protein YkgB